MNDYKLPVGEFWNESNLDSLILLRELGEQRLANTVQYFHRMHDRTFRYIGYLVPVCTGLIYFLWLEANGNGTVTGGAWPFLLVILLTACYCVYTMAFMQLPQPLYNEGEQPRRIGLAEYVASSEDHSMTKEEQYLALLINRIENLQESIEENEATGAYMQQKLTWVLKLIVGVFLLSVLVLLAVSAGQAWGG